jgi:hypothetical protein
MNIYYPIKAVKHNICTTFIIYKNADDIDEQSTCVHPKMQIE